MSHDLMDACEQAIELAADSKQYMEDDQQVHPLVGAVILDENGRQLSAGARKEDRRSHAEVVAIKRLGVRQKKRVHTVVTTLEPCCSRSDPDQICCSKRIVRLGAKQVIIGTLDPATSVRGRGAQILQIRDVYFSMFPKRLQAKVIEANKSYIEYESELYGSGKKPRLRTGIVKDDQEFNLDFAPRRVADFLTSEQFWNIMKDVYVESKRREILDTEFEKFFAITATAPNSRIATMVERMLRGITLFELIARYMAFPKVSSIDLSGTESKLVYGSIAKWWYRNRRRNRASLRATLRRCAIPAAP